MGVNRIYDIKKIILTVLTGFCIIFIFMQSLLNGNVSGAESGKVVDFLNHFFNSLGIDITFSAYFIRKLAHFTEFTILGFSAYFTVKSYENYKNKSYIITPLIYVLVAVIDECLQLFTVGRACSVFDMLIDSSGGTFGFILACLIHKIFLLRNSKNKKFGGDYNEG